MGPNASKDPIDKECATTTWEEAPPGAADSRPHPHRALQDAHQDLPKPRLLLGNRISTATGTGRCDAAQNRGGRAHAASLSSSETGIHSVPVAMKTGHTPAIPARACSVRRRARRSAHEQCGLKPASPSLRRQLRRCGCHYGPLQSEGGAAWLGACGRRRVGVGARAGLGGGSGARRLPAPAPGSGP